MLVLILFEQVVLLRMYCIDRPWVPESHDVCAFHRLNLILSHATLVFMFNGGSSYGFTKASVSMQYILKDHVNVPSFDPIACHPYLVKLGLPCRC